VLVNKRQIATNLYYCRIGVGVVVLCCIVIIITLIVIISRKRKGGDSKDEIALQLNGRGGDYDVFKASKNANRNSQSISRSPSFSKSPSSLSLTLESTTLDINFVELKFAQEVGRGAFGVVYKGLWRGGDVAIKRMLTEANVMKENDVADFLNEAQLMKNLRPHTNVVQYQGICLHDGFYFIVTEFVPGGSLLSLIRSERSLNLEDQFKIARGMAAGILHLHFEGIIHRDLAARNILLAKDLTPKVSDFGMSRFNSGVSDESNKTQSTTGPLKWMAPECLTEQEYSVKSDVWAYAVTVYEMLSREEPYPGLDKVQVATRVGNNKLKLEAPENANRRFKVLIAACTTYQVKLRPNMEDVVKYFSLVESHLYSSEEIDVPVTEFGKGAKEKEMDLPPLPVRDENGKTGYETLNGGNNSGSFNPRTSDRSSDSNSQTNSFNPRASTSSNIRRVPSTNSLGSYGPMPNQQLGSTSGSRVSLSTNSIQLDPYGVMPAENNVSGSKVTLTKKPLPPTDPYGPMPADNNNASGSNVELPNIPPKRPTLPNSGSKLNLDQNI